MVSESVEMEKATRRATRAAAPAAPRELPRWAITTGSVIAVVLLWEYFGRQANPLFGSYPIAIVGEMIEMTQNGRLPEAFMASMKPFLTGFALATVAGIAMGLLLGRSRFMEAALGIYVTAGNATPLIAVVPLFILWFGLGFTAKVAIITTLSFFPICISTWTGVKSTAKSLIEVGESFVASPRDILFKIVLPSSVPHVMGGLRLAIGKGVIALVVAEFFTALTGLGGIILTAANNFETAQMFAPIIVLMVFAVLLTSLLRWLERRIAPWHMDLTGQSE